MNRVTFFIALVMVLLPSGGTREQAMVRAEAKSSQEVTPPDLLRTPRNIVEKDLEAGQTDASTFTLQQGQYGQLVIECWGVNIRATIYDPNNAVVSEITCYRSALTPISILAGVSGPYRLDLRADGDGAQAGHYRLTPRQLRRATLNDASRIAVETTFTQAERLRVEGLKGSGEQAISKYEEARDRWLAMGDEYNAIYATMNAG